MKAKLLGIVTGLAIPLTIIFADKAHAESYPTRDWYMNECVGVMGIPYDECIMNDLRDQIQMEKAFKVLEDAVQKKQRAMMPKILKKAHAVLARGSL